MVRTEWQFRTRQGQSLYAARWPPASSPKAILIFNHGYGEHCGRYDAVFTKLASHGIEVRSFDMRSFGRSEQDVDKRGKIASLFDNVDDLEDFINDAAAVYSPSELPFFLAGSSLGALIALHALLRTTGPFRGLLLFSPLLDIEWTPLLRVQALFGALLARLAPHARLVPAVRPEDMSPDPAVQKEYIDDPLNFVGNTRALTAQQVLLGMKALWPMCDRITLPVYGQHGSKDLCTSVPAHRRFNELIPSSDKTLNIVEGGFHELLMGPEKEQCTAVIIDWILRHAALPQAASKI